MRTSRPITVTLGKQQANLDAYLEDGTYDSASEVLRAGLRALDRERQAIDEIMRTRIIEALRSDKPLVPAKEAFQRIRKALADRVDPGA